MAEINLTQTEADLLIAMEKYCVDSSKVWEFPDMGGSISVPLVSKDKKENFLLDVSRGRIDLIKHTFQNRTRQAIVLVRLDIGGSPHRNPDGEEIPSPHLHIYRENYGDKWAIPLTTDKFSNLSDNKIILKDFMEYCRITQPPKIIMGLFS